MIGFMALRASTEVTFTQDSATPDIKRNMLKSKAVLGVAILASSFTVPVVGNVAHAQTVNGTQSTVSNEAGKTNFLSTIVPAAQQAASGKDLYVSVMLAQAILESGWGTSQLSTAPNNNLFGIKGQYNGQSVTMETSEVYNGQVVAERAAFRKYPTYTESFLDNANLLLTRSFTPGEYFYSGAWKSNTSSYKDATSWLTGRYATDPSYGYKLNEIIAKYNLTQYDEGSSDVVASTETTIENLSTGSTQSAGKVEQSHTVVSGDTLYSIAKRYGLQVHELQTMNSMSSTSLAIGQVLAVKYASDTETSSTEETNASSGELSSSTTSSSTGSNTHTVASGETLYRIAKNNNVSVDDLMKWNGLSSNSLSIGQVLKLSEELTVSEAHATTEVVQLDTTPDLTVTETLETTSNETNASYTVVSQDTLWKISRKYNCTPDDLKKWNGLSSDALSVGQVLKVNDTASSTEEVATVITPTVEVSPTVTSSENTYTVKSGDTLWSIARNHGVSLDEVKSWNNLSSTLIFVGQVLKFDGATSSQTTASNVGTTTYTVKAGDTLWSIARSSGMDLAELRKVNNLKDNFIVIGQTLTLNGEVSSSTNVALYTVKAGDTLYSLAKKNNTTVDSLKQTNSLSSDLIKVTQNLIIGSNK